RRSNIKIRLIRHPANSGISTRVGKLPPSTEGPIMSNDTTQSRRGFLGTAVISLAAARFGAITPPASRAPFGPIKQIDAGLLNVGYVDMGPGAGRPVVLLHGWPYDINSYADVAPRLASKGYRVIVPYLRGYGTTRFLAADTFRNGQQSVVALDIKALM